MMGWLHLRRLCHKSFYFKHLSFLRTVAVPCEYFYSSLG